MERLTERTKNGIAMVKGCGENCKYGFEFCRKEDWENCKTIDDVIDKLATYEDADEQGRLLRLPCKVGATVYLIDDGKVVPRTADMMFLGVLWDEYGKGWFLTKEEAEAKLEGWRNSMDKFWSDTMNCLLGEVLYHGKMPDAGYATWCEQYKPEVSSMIEDIMCFYKRNHEAGLEVSNEAMARFLVYTEAAHICNKHLVNACAIDESYLLVVSAEILDELN